MFFPELLIEATDSTLRIKVTGPRSALDRLKQYLTITNTSVSWQIREANKKLLANRVRGISDDSTYSQYHLKQLAELLPLETEKLYFDEGTHLILPAGFFYLAKNATDFMDGRVKPYYLDKLRDYQKRAVMQALEKKRGVVQSSTGTGKSLMIASLCLSLVKAGKRVCVVVPSDYLVKQTYEVIKAHHDSTTMAGGGRHPVLGSDILVVTAMSAKKYISSYQALAIDEVQYQAASTWQDLVIAAEDAEYVYGFTATPFRSDGLDLVINAYCGPVVFEYSARQAIADGWLTKPSIYCVEINTDLKFSGTAQKAYRALVCTPEVFSFIEKKINGAIANGNKTILIFKTVVAANLFKKYAKTLSFDVAHADYKKPMDDFADGSVNLLVACDRLVAVGVNLPTADVLILATQHSSDVLSYQSVGRVLRLSKDKENATVIDICVNGFSQFENGAKRRRRVYKEITDNVFKVKV